MFEGLKELYVGFFDNILRRKGYVSMEEASGIFGEVLPEYEPFGLPHKRFIPPFTGREYWHPGSYGGVLRRLAEAVRDGEKEILLTGDNLASWLLFLELGRSRESAIGAGVDCAIGGIELEFRYDSPWL